MINNMKKDLIVNIICGIITFIVLAIATLYMVGIIGGDGHLFCRC